MSLNGSARRVNRIMIVSLGCHSAAEEVAERVYFLSWLGQGTRHSALWTVATAICTCRKLDWNQEESRRTAHCAVAGPIWYGLCMAQFGAIYAGWSHSSAKRNAVWDQSAAHDAYADAVRCVLLPLSLAVGWWILIPRAWLSLWSRKTFVDRAIERWSARWPNARFIMFCFHVWLRLLKSFLNEIIRCVFRIQTKGLIWRAPHVRPACWQWQSLLDVLIVLNE